MACINVHVLLHACLGAVQTVQNNKYSSCLSPLLESVAAVDL